MADPQFFPPGTFCADFSTANDIDMRILENQFTAGFTWKNKDGINTIRDSWSVRYSQLTFAQMLTIHNFLEARKGVEAFMWQAPREASYRKWVCLSLKRTPVSQNNWTITATYRRDFQFHLNEVHEAYIPGAVALGRAGLVQGNAVSPNPFQYVSGTAGVGLAGYVMPLTLITMFDRVQSLLIVGDNLIVNEYNTRVLRKYNKNTLAFIASIDMDDHAIGGVGFGGEVTDISTDGTSIMGVIQNRRDYFKLNVSDFTTVTIADYNFLTDQYTGGHVVYNGHFYFIVASYDTKIYKVNIASWTIVGTLSVLAIAPNFTWVEYFGGRLSGNKWYIPNAYDIGDLGFLVVDLDSFSVAGSTYYITNALIEPYGWNGRAAEDATWVYFANWNDGVLQRVKKSNPNIQEEWYFYVEADYYVYWFDAMHVDGNYLYASAWGEYIVRVDTTSAPVFKDCTFDILWMETLKVANYGTNDSLIDGNFYYGAGGDTPNARLWRIPKNTPGQPNPYGPEIYPIAAVHANLTGAPNTIHTFSFVDFDFSTQSNVHIIWVAARFASGTGSIVGLTVNGGPATKIDEVVNGTGVIAAFLFDWNQYGENLNPNVQVTASNAMSAVSIQVQWHGYNDGMPDHIAKKTGLGATASVNLQLPQNSVVTAMAIVEGNFAGGVWTPYTEVTDANNGTHHMSSSTTYYTKQLANHTGQLITYTYTLPANYAILAMSWGN